MPPACEHCWARSMARRFHPEGLDGVQALPKNLDKPLRRRMPTVFASQISYGDLFHPDVPDEFISEAISYGREAADQGHQIVLLTKRPERVPRFIQCAETARGLTILASVWDQASTDVARDVLGQLPGTRWGLHMEPLLSEVSVVNAWASCRGCRLDPHPHWIVVGGESGPGARPMHPNWVRQIREECQLSGIPFYFKGWGGRNKKAAGRLLDGREHNEVPW